MLLLAVVVVLIPYICPISPVTGVEMTATPWESAADEAAAAAVRIVGGEITSIKNYPFIVCVRRAHFYHAHRPLNLSPFAKNIGLPSLSLARIVRVHRERVTRTSDVKRNVEVNAKRIVQGRAAGAVLSTRSKLTFSVSTRAREKTTHKISF